VGRKIVDVRRWILCALTGVCAIACTSAVAADPLPPKRPADLAAPAPPTVAQANAEDNDTLRTQVLASRRIIGEALAPIDDKGGCIIAAPLRVDAVVLANNAKVVLSPAVIMRASLASVVADWVREDLASAIAKGDRLISIEGAGGYECRSRDRIAGAKLSEHATGNALDLHALRTANGKFFVIAASKEDSDEVKAFRALVKKTACKRFATVLGPGADRFHAEHLHVDLAVRRNGMHLCQWTIESAQAKQ
jgi:hypothetical protein